MIESSGVSKSKTVEIPLETGQRKLVAEAILSCEGLPDIQCKLQLPASVWLVNTSADPEAFAELLLGGSLSFMQSKQVSTPAAVTPDSFESVIDGILDQLEIVKVEVQSSTASLYAEASDGSRLALLVKLGSAGLGVEGRGEDKELLSGVLEEIVNILQR